MKNNDEKASVPTSSQYQNHRDQNHKISSTQLSHTKPKSKSQNQPLYPFDLRERERERERERNVGLQHFWCHHYQSHHSSWWWCNHGFVLWRFLILLYTHLLLINSFMLGTQFFQPQDLENKLHILLSLSFSF